VAEDAYYLDGSRNQQGPVPMAEIARLIRGGTIRRDTLVWYAGMPEWRPAGQVSDFAALFAPAAPPPRPAGGPLPPQGPRPAGQAPRFSAGAGDRIALQGIAPQSMAPERMAPSMDTASGGAGPTDALVSQLGVWGFFWRVLVVGLGWLLIIPSPWTNTMFYRYIVETTWLPSGRRLVFAGKPGDIWYVFIGMSLVFLVGVIPYIPFAGLLTLPLSLYLNYLVLCWIVEKTGTEDGSMKLEFTGGFWGYFGWFLLLMLSIITIIGWAWVTKFFIRWMCRNVSGTTNFDFVGTGWGILWRYLVFGLVAWLLIPIPWLIRWFTAWFISQVRTGEVATHFD
jgi:uncharacterized protein DUF4339